jgi:hypothetical protein
MVRLNAFLTGSTWLAICSAKRYIGGIGNGLQPQKIWHLVHKLVIASLAMAHLCTRLVSIVNPDLQNMTTISRFSFLHALTMWSDALKLICYI